MNKVYLYEGDFYSLIALIVELIKKRIIPGDIDNINEYEDKLFDEVMFLEVDEYRNRELLNKYLSKRVLGSIYYTFLSDNSNKEMIIYNFIKAALVYKNKVFGYRKLDCVNDVIRISRRVGGEAHKLKGFLRFKELKNSVLYGVINPTNNVIGILAYHFQKRLSNEYWIIKDENRGIYALYDKRKVIYLNDEDIIKLNLELGEKEEMVEELWKTFFKTIAIKDRENKRCQMNFMPKKYWKNILEMEEEYEESNS